MVYTRYYLTVTGSWLLSALLGFRFLNEHKCHNRVKLPVEVHMMMLAFSCF